MIQNKLLGSQSTSVLINSSNHRVQVEPRGSTVIQGSASVGDLNALHINTSILDFNTVNNMEEVRQADLRLNGGII